MAEQLAKLDNLEEVDTSVIAGYLQELPDKVLHLGIRVLLALAIFLIGLQLIKLLRRIVKRSLIRGGADAGVIQFLDSFIKAALCILLVFFIASGFGLDAASVVALLGSAGVAIGLAIQGSLSNFAGGVLILLLKPFKIGDYIKMENGVEEGTVVEIQLFYTKLATPDNRKIIMPNGALSNSSLMNASAAHDRRIDISVGISYDADIHKAREVLTAMMTEDSSVVQEKEKRVFVSELGASAVQLGIRCWTSNEVYWETKWRLTEQTKYALDAAGIQIPYPQLDVHMDEKILNQEMLIEKTLNEEK